MPTPSAQSPATATASAAEGLLRFRPRILHVAYHVADIDRALAFYVGVLGMKEQMRIKLGGGEQEVILQFPESKGSGVILMWNTERKTPYQLGDSYSRFVMMVSDLDGALEHVMRHGAQVETPATQAGTMRYAMIKDPDGYVLELLQLK
jgi:predicted enzyme related to lactoylglutathione lyase